MEQTQAYNLNSAAHQSPTGWMAKMAWWIGAFLVANIGAALPLAPFALRPPMPWWVTIVAAWLTFLFLLGAAWLMALYLDHRPLRSFGLAFHSLWAPEILRGAAIGVGLMSSVMLTLTALGAYRITGVKEGAGPACLWAVILGVGILGVALMEEFSMRGYPLQTLLRRFRPGPAILGTAVVFSLLHLFNPGENPLGIMEVFCAGFLLAIPTVRTRSLWTAVGLHAAWDWSQNFLFSTPDSGLVMPGGLLNSTPGGPAWLSGGRAGPEGSIVAIIVTLLAAFWLSRVSWLKPSYTSDQLWDRYVTGDAGVKSPPPPSATPQLDFDLSGFPRRRFDVAYAPC